MARVKLIQTETGSPAVQSVFERIQSERGIVGNLLKVLAHNPTFLEPVIGLGYFVARSRTSWMRTQGRASTVSASAVCRERATDQVRPPLRLRPSSSPSPSAE